MVLGFMAVHLQTQHGKIKGRETALGKHPPVREPHTYRMAFPTYGVPRNRPIEGCPGRVAKRTAMRAHLFHRNVRDTVIIFEEVKLPQP